MKYEDNYNESKLHEEDRRAVMLMETAMDEAINSAEIKETGVDSIDKLMNDVAEAIKAKIRANYENIMYNIMVSTIEGYSEEEVSQ